MVYIVIAWSIFVIVTVTVFVIIRVGVNRLATDEDKKRPDLDE